jgi:hypothetical protein
MSKKQILTIVYTLAVVLLFLRVDLWWWGKKIHPIIAGWITFPMIYQMFIWAAGVALVYTICYKVWDIDDKPEKGDN